MSSKNILTVKKLLLIKCHLILIGIEGKKFTLMLII